MLKNTFKAISLNSRYPGCWRSGNVLLVPWTGTLQLCRVVKARVESVDLPYNPQESVMEYTPVNQTPRRQWRLRPSQMTCVVGICTLAAWSLPLGPTTLAITPVGTVLRETSDALSRRVSRGQNECRERSKYRGGHWDLSLSTTTTTTSSNVVMDSFPCNALRTFVATSGHVASRLVISLFSLHG
jgi:hypothetical protein